MLDSASQTCDVAIVGGGPAGLAAAVYLARFLRSVRVFDSGDARARLIPRTRNCPGFPDGIAGEALLVRLRRQAKVAGATLVEARVEGIKRKDGSYELTAASGVVLASRVVLATGIVDKAPPIAGLREAIAAGSVRLCPICDAYEAAGQRIGVVGPEHLALKEALFLRDYSAHVSILFNYPDQASRSTREQAQAAGIEVWDVVDDLVATGRGFDVAMADGFPTRQLDIVYPAMGCDVRSELARSLGAACDGAGHVLVGSHLETSVPGLYAIGDVSSALNQIAVGFGHAALAATHIHNALREQGMAQRKRASA